MENQQLCWLNGKLKKYSYEKNSEQSHRVFLFSLQPEKHNFDDDNRLLKITFPKFLLYQLASRQIICYIRDENIFIPFSVVSWVITGRNFLLLARPFEVFDLCRWGNLKYFFHFALLVVSKFFNFMLRKTWKIASNVEGNEDNSSEPRRENDFLDFFQRKFISVCKTLAFNPPAGEDNKV